MNQAILAGPRRTVLQLHRRALWAALALFGAAAVTLVVLRLRVDTLDTTGPCRGGTGCNDAIQGLVQAHEWLRTGLDQVATGVLLLPLAIAAFAAGPLIARELETGTYRLAWTQSVTPAGWLAAKLLLPAVVVTAGTAVLVAAFRWSRPPTTGNGAGMLWDSPVYASMGVTTFAYGLLALAVGALTGLLVRRTVVAMSLAGLATGGLMLLVTTLRPHLWPVATRSAPGDEQDLWILQQGKLTASGERLFWEDCYNISGPQTPEQCMSARGAVGDFHDVHPSSHFWPLQLVETGIVLALAAAAVAAAFWLLRRRHG
ncbi:ABC transporter permease [Streptomyces sp. NPDC008141]|uniref:ABC transporter permease n=1 Tax=Streptomyces sp. NPDC008141 TaxID=3364815 RepID=UPI0036E45AFA